MRRAIPFIGVIIYFGWAMALIFNYKIYEYTTTQSTLFHPVIDGILFVGVLLFILWAIFILNERREGIASIALFVVGIISVVFAMMYL